MSRFKLLVGLVAAVVLFQGQAALAHALLAPARVWVKSGPSAGQVTLYWDAVGGSDHYALAYGQTSGNYIYGATDVGSGTQYTISGLTPGQRYYIVVAGATNNNDSSPFSAEVSALAASGTVAEARVTQAAAPAQVTTAAAQPPVVKYQGTMKTDASLNPAEETTGRRGVGAYNLRAVTGPAQGQVTLFWNQPAEIDVVDYNVVYTADPQIEKWGR